MPVRYLTISKFALESGYTENAIRTKIRDGVWREGAEWVKAPDGRVLIDVEGFNAWAGSAAALNRIPRRHLSPPPLVSGSRRP